MGFKMNGSPAKMGTIRGTAGHRSALKDMKTGKYAHSFEDDAKQTPAYLKNFGIGKGTSPVLFDPSGKSKKEIMAMQTALGIKADGIWGPQSTAHMKASKLREAGDTKGADKIISDYKTSAKEKSNQKSNVSTTSSADAIIDGAVEENQDKKEGVDDSAQRKANKKQGLLDLGDLAITAFTHGTDAVYGTKAVNALGSTLIEPDEEEEEEETTAQKIIKGDA